MRLGNLDIGMLASRFLRVLGWAFRVACMVFVFFAALGAITYVGHVPVLSQAMRIVESLVPSPVTGMLCFATPTGGLLRGDFILSAVASWVLGWVCFQVSTSLR